MITHAHVITVYVTDQQRALEFWRDSAGFEVRDDAEFMPQARWITVAPPGAQTCLALWPAGLEQTPGRQPGGFSGISFITGDMAQLHATYTERGVKFTQQPELLPWGLSAMFADPDGNEFNVVEQK